MADPIYLDHHATTPLDPRVLEAMLPWLGARCGNPSSRSHRFGWEAAEAVEEARGEVAALIGASAREVIFTSGTTESNNLALKGCVDALGGGGHLVTTAIEHRAVLDPVRWLAARGVEVTVLAVGAGGVVEVAAVAAALGPSTRLISIMAANNEVGTLQPIGEVGRLARERGVLLHSDAAQAVGKVPIDVEAMAIDLLSFSAHKMYGPKGVGALYLRRRGRRVRLSPQMHGGGQESGLRPGTLPVALIVGFGRAAAIARAEMAAEAERVGRLRDRLRDGLNAALDGVEVNGDPERRLPGNLSVSFAGVDGEALLVGLKDIAVSSGAACSAGSSEPSHVLRALGIDDDRAVATLLFGLGRFNTEDEIDRAVVEVARVARRLRTIAAAVAPRR